MMRKKRTYWRCNRVWSKKNYVYWKNKWLLFKKKGNKSRKQTKRFKRRILLKGQILFWRVKEIQKENVKVTERRKTLEKKKTKRKYFRSKTISKQTNLRLKNYWLKMKIFPKLKTKKKIVVRHLPKEKLHLLLLVKGFKNKRSYKINWKRTVNVMKMKRKKRNSKRKMKKKRKLLKHHWVSRISSRIVNSKKKIANVLQDSKLFRFVLRKNVKILHTFAHPMSANHAHNFIKTATWDLLLKCSRKLSTKTYWGKNKQRNKFSTLGHQSLRLYYPIEENSIQTYVSKDIQCKIKIIWTK